MVPSTQNHRYRSSCAPVKRGRPVQCKSSTQPVNWNRFHVLTTSLWVRCTHRATSLVDKPSLHNVMMWTRSLVLIVLHGMIDVHFTAPQTSLMHPYWCFTFNWNASVHSSAALYPQVPRMLTVCMFTNNVRGDLPIGTGTVTIETHLHDISGWCRTFVDVCNLFLTCAFMEWK